MTHLKTSGRYMLAATTALVLSELAAKTGIVTKLAGPSNSEGAAWADIRYFGITADANIDEAEQFIKYSIDQGYTQTLSIAPEGKFPVRRGTEQEPEKFVIAWSKLPVGVDRKAALSELYPAEMIDEIVAGLDVAQRWDVREGQLSLASKIINSQVINRVVRQYIDGEIDAPGAVAEMNAELAKIQQAEPAGPVAITFRPHCSQPGATMQDNATPPQLPARWPGAKRALPGQCWPRPSSPSA